MASERMRLAMAHLAGMAVQLQDDANAGYIDYDDTYDRRGCRPEDSSDDEVGEVSLEDLEDVEAAGEASHHGAAAHGPSEAEPAPPESKPSHSAAVGSSFARLESELDAQFARLKAAMNGGGQEASSSSDTDTMKVEGGAAATAEPKAGPAVGGESSAVPPVGSAAGAPGTAEYYDDLYFDSDDEGGAVPKGAAGEGTDEGVDTTRTPDTTSQTKSSRRKPKRPVLSHLDLFYDPDIDDENQQWMDRQRDLRGRNPFDEFGEDDEGAATHSSGPASVRGVAPPGAPPGMPMPSAAAAAAAHNTKKGMAAAPTSDAILNCSACMTTLCLDCQRHDTYQNQFRAMFVHNCKIDRSESLVFRKKGKKKRRSSKGREMPTLPDEEYHPVVCSECGAVVAVLDHDEVYHFFDVIASLP